MSDAGLFGVEEGLVSKVRREHAAGRVRVQRAERLQIEFRGSSLDEGLPDEPRARVIWDALKDLDLGAFYQGVGSREGSAGRPAIDPRILVALWLYATS